MSQCFDAHVVFDQAEENKKKNVLVNFSDSRIQGVLNVYNNTEKENGRSFYVNISLSTPVELKWRDNFILESSGGKKQLGTGTVLNPFAAKIKQNLYSAQSTFLAGLNGSQADMILALAKKNGSQGLVEKEVQRFSRLTETRLEEIVGELEIEGRVRILSFLPLFLLEKSSFEFICQKLAAYIEKCHVQNPDKIGLSIKHLNDKFELQPRVMALALKSLQAAGKIKQLSDRFVPGFFKLSILPEEEELLQEMEKLSREGEFRSVSLQEFQLKFQLSSAKLDRLLTIMTEQKKIVRAKDGFYLYSEWLEGIIDQLRKSGKKEISVGEFKALTGLTRKYAIPLLELLDQMGVTRRQGSIHEIL